MKRVVAEDREKRKTSAASLYSKESRQAPVSYKGKEKG